MELNILIVYFLFNRKGHKGIRKVHKAIILNLRHICNLYYIVSQRREVTKFLFLPSSLFPLPSSLFPLLTSKL